MVIIYMQLFIDEIPLCFLNEVLEQFFIKQKDYYVLDYVGFKKILFHNFQTTWLQEIRPYYHKSKRFYVDRKFTFNSFVNIIRQICKLYGIQYKSFNDKTTGYKYFKYHIFI